jgi:putative transposase
MPSRNIIREFAPDQYYHVYNRGVEKRIIFHDEQDYTVFLGLLKKYLTGERQDKNNRHPVNALTHKVELLAYCLMPNHFHLLLYQPDEQGVTQLVRRVATGYAMYFNNRYKRVGALFQGKYKASVINKDAYLDHVSRYIHLNPKNYHAWKYTSLPYYQGKKRADWINANRILELFDSRQAYLDFVEDYESNKRELDVLKWQLADNAESQA